MAGGASHEFCRESVQQDSEAWSESMRKMTAHHVFGDLLSATFAANFAEVTKNYAPVSSPHGLSNFTGLTGSGDVKIPLSSFFSFS